MDRESSLPIKAHLYELRRRLITCAVTLAVAFACCYAVSGYLVDLLFLPVRMGLPQGGKMVFTALTEGFMTYLKVSFWAAVIITTPVFLYQLWKFISPGLLPGEQRVMRIILITGTLLFCAGGIFGYWVIMPVVISIMMGYAGPDLQAMPRLQNYLLFALKSIFTFGLIFEIPFLMTMAIKSGLITTEYFRKNRKFAYIGMYLMAVMLVPTDIFSQLLLCLPLSAIYEVGILLGSIFSREESEEVKEEIQSRELQEKDTTDSD